MTPELLTVGVGGVALAGLILSNHCTLIQRLERLEDRLAAVEREQAHLDLRDHCVSAS